MAGPAPEPLDGELKTLTADLHGVERSLSTGIHRVETAVARLSAEFGLFKWLVGAALVASVSGIISSAFWAGSLSARVTTLEARADKVDVRLTAIENRLGVVENRLTAVEATLARIEATLNRIAASPEPRKVGQR